MSLGVRCFAKINTTLRVLGRRPDGFHDLDLDFVGLELCDELVLEPADGFTLSVEGAGEAALGGSENLVLRAARSLQGVVGRDRLPGAAMRLVKRIPVAAGLGGGSSDAAGALEGLVRMHALTVPTGNLAALALELGSDVPYFLRGGRQRGRGRGEILTDLPDLPDLPVLLLKPPFPLSTPRVFAEHARWRSEHPDEAARGTLTSRKTLPNLGPGWGDGSKDGLGVHDDLADAAVRLEPRIVEVAEAAERAFPEGAVGMTGSGPTVFVLLPQETGDPGPRLRSLRGLADVRVTRTIGREAWRARRFT